MPPPRQGGRRPELCRPGGPGFAWQSLLCSGATLLVYTPPPGSRSFLGRKVRAFVRGIDTEQDVSSEVFYREPRI
jgi:hypothetical protein